MSVKLSVFNIPSGLSLKEFSGAFMDLPGYKNALFVNAYHNQTYSPPHHSIGGIVEFSCYQSAEYASSRMQNYRFPGSASGIGTAPA